MGRGRVFVTGGTGFIGQRLVRHLAEAGHEVSCLVRRSSAVDKLTSYSPRLLYGDVSDAESVAAAVEAARPERVFHLAGLTNTLSPGAFDRINHQGVPHVAQACAAQATPPTLLVVSSLAAAGPAPLGRARVEDDPAAPVSNYGRSKRAGELAAHRFADVVPTTIVRPPIVFGPGDAATLEMYRPIARFGLHVVPGMRDKLFSLVHADDLVTAMVLLAERGERIAAGPEQPSAAGYYFVADGEPLGYAELGRQIGVCLGRRRTKILHVPNPLVWLSGALQQFCSLCTGKPSMLSLDKAREATAGPWVCSPLRLQTSLGFTPAKSLAARLEETLAWYRDERWL